jgi:hypothetical protein
MEVDLPSSVLAASSGSLVGTHGVPASMDVGSAGATVAQQAGYPAAAAASGASAQPDDLSTLSVSSKRVREAATCGDRMLTVAVFFAAVWPSAQ